MQLKNGHHMLKRTPSLKLPIFFAVLLHVLLLNFLFFKPPVTQYRMQASHQKQLTHIVQATAVSQAAVTAQIKQINRQRAEKRAKLRAIKEEKIRAAKRLARKKAVAKARRLRLARQKKQKLLREKRKKARERKLKTLMAQQKKLQDQLMKQQLAGEKKALQKIASQAVHGMIDKYKAQILSVIQSNWRINQVNAKLRCIYDISVGPGGVVLGVKLLKSSGSDALDQSARVAIFRSSPLPVPKDPALFDSFRHLVLTLSPQGYVSP